jgi:hypothetical protein
MSTQTNTGISVDELKKAIKENIPVAGDNFSETLFEGKIIDLITNKALGSETAKTLQSLGVDEKVIQNSLELIQNLQPKSIGSSETKRGGRY